MIKFEDMPYERPDLDKVKEELKELADLKVNSLSAKLIG